MKPAGKPFIAALSLFLVLALWPVRPLRSDAPVIDPGSYPGIGDQELGQLRWILQIADQPLEDFTNLEAANQKRMTAYRYSIAFTTYFLAVEQYHKLPACPEIIKPRMDRLIQKMIEKPVWEFWAEVSRGVPYLEPDMDKPYPEEHDPVGKKNIMYSGHLGHMIGLYEMLYRDFKWDEQGSIVFAWSDNEKYIYNNHSLQKAMYDQMKKEPHCIECEPNACFPECNQHPVLSFMLYDFLHGTSLAEVRDLFLDFFLEKQMINPRTHETAGVYLIKQDLTVGQSNPRLGNAYDLILTPAAGLGIISVDSTSANGWTGTFMHAWQPEYIERHYPYQRDHHLIEVDGESARLRYDYFEPRLQYGFFAMLASEVGDIDTRDRLLKYSDQKYQPVWENKTFHYPPDKSKDCAAMTGKLLAIARANPKNGMWTMHNKPFDDDHFKEPVVVGVDFPDLVLRRAIYDREKGALIVSYEPGTEKRGNTTFVVKNLDPRKSYRHLIDSKEAARYQGRAEVKIEAALDQRHDMVLMEL